MTRGVLAAVLVSGAIHLAACLDASEASPPVQPPPPPPPPPVGGDPTPGPNATVYLDTRKGGTQDLQAPGVTTLTLADALLHAFDNSHAGTAVWGFTTNVDGHGLHAYVVEWVGQGANCVDANATRVIRFASAPNHVFFQWKQWMGRTTTGGGMGTVGDFTINNPNCVGAGRKMWLAYRAPNDGTGRVDYIWQGPSPPTVVFEGWAGLSPNPGRLFQNQRSDFRPDSAIGRVNTYTLEYQAESAVGASDGMVRLWVNGVKRLEYLHQPTGTTGFAAAEFPTIFRAPLRDQTEYSWDLVAWSP